MRISKGYNQSICKLAQAGVCETSGCVNELLCFNTLQRTYGGAKQYTYARLPTGSPLDGTVRQVLGSAHI